MKRAIIVSFAALLLLAGCDSQKQSPGIPIPPKWQGAPYHLAFGPAPAKPNPSGITLPPVKYTANPDMLETRADLVINVDTSSIKSKTPVLDKMVMGAVDIPGSEGTLPTEYMNTASAELSKMLSSYCVKGKVKISVALTRSSIPLSATEDQINAKRLSDWLPIELDFKNPHPKC